MTPQWQALKRDFGISLEAESKSPNTLRLYLGAVDKLGQWMQEHDGPDDPRAVWLLAWLSPVGTDRPLS